MDATSAINKAKEVLARKRKAVELTAPSSAALGTAVTGTTAILTSSVVTSTPIPPPTVPVDRLSPIQFRDDDADNRESSERCVKSRQNTIVASSSAPKRKHWWSMAPASQFAGKKFEELFTNSYAMQAVEGLVKYHIYVEAQLAELQQSRKDSLHYKKKYEEKYEDYKKLEEELKTVQKERHELVEANKKLEGRHQTLQTAKEKMEASLVAANNEVKKQKNELTSKYDALLKEQNERYDTFLNDYTNLKTDYETEISVNKKLLQQNIELKTAKCKDDKDANIALNYTLYEFWKDNPEGNFNSVVYPGEAIEFFKDMWLGERGTLEGMPNLNAFEDLIVKRGISSSSFMALIPPPPSPAASLNLSASPPPPPAASLNLSASPPPPVSSTFVEPSVSVLAETSTVAVTSSKGQLISNLDTEEPKGVMEKEKSKEAKNGKEKDGAESSSDKVPLADKKSRSKPKPK